jgi:hypothetical protein
MNADPIGVRLSTKSQASKEKKEINLKLFKVIQLPKLCLAVIICQAAPAFASFHALIFYLGNKLLCS